MHQKTVAGLAVTLLLGASACGILGLSPSAGASSSSGAAVPAQPTPADPSQTTAGDQLGQAVARRTSAVGGKMVTMVLYPVVRAGTTSHVNFTLSSPSPRTSSVQVAQTLADNNFDAIDKSGSTADGVQLVDGKHAKLYLVASDGAGQCLCSRNLSGVFLSENAPVLFLATSAAPPADVTTVDVRVPSFGTVKSVPVR